MPFPARCRICLVEFRVNKARISLALDSSNIGAAVYFCVFASSVNSKTKRFAIFLITYLRPEEFRVRGITQQEGQGVSRSRVCSIVVYRRYLSPSQSSSRWHTPCNACSDQRHHRPLHYIPQGRKVHTVEAIGVRNRISSAGIEKNDWTLSLAQDRHMQVFTQ